jgi:hypothetical protein
MKKLIYFILGTTLFSISCKPDRDCCLVLQRGAEMTAQRNGVLWNPFGVKGIFSEIDSLTIDATNASQNAGTITRIDTMTIKIAYNGNGVYTLAPNQVFYATFSNNGTLNSYAIDPTFDNELDITSYQTLDNPYTTNPNEVEMKGTFKIKFIDPNNPAGISFSNGSFYVIMDH